MDEDIKLIKTRKNAFIKTDSYFGDLVRPYTLEAIDKEEIALILSKVDREYIKECLTLLCPDFVQIFARMGFEKNSKKENYKLLELLEDHLLHIEKIINIDELIELKADEVYKECEELENFLKQYKRDNPDWVYSLDAEFVRRKEKELERLSGLDVEEWVLGSIEAVRIEYSNIIETIKRFYEKGLSNNMRQTEVRNRNLFFVLILQGLCFFYDFYEPEFFYSKGAYSVLDIIAVRSSIRGCDRYPLTAGGLYDCLDCFCREVDEFELLNSYGSLRGLRLLNGLDD